NPGGVPWGEADAMVIHPLSMTRMRVNLGAMFVGGVVALALPTALLAASRAGGGGDGKLTLDGRVGPLQFNRSTEARIIAFAGRPAATGTGNFSAYPPDPDYFAMGYGCQEHSSGWLFMVDRYDYC